MDNSRTRKTASLDAQQLKAAVLELRGYWHPFHQGLLEMAPGYLAAYLGYQNAPAKAARLDEKVIELIYIAVDASVGHLYASGTARHIEMALEKGASSAEIVEVIQLAMLASRNSIDAGLSILIEELGVAGRKVPRGSGSLTPENQAAKDAYIKAVGDWPSYGDVLLDLSPEFARAFLAYAEIPYRAGPLAPKIKEFIGIALHAFPGAPQPDRLRHHIRRALLHGATPEEIVDVLALSSAVAIHTCTLAIPLLSKAIGDRPDDAAADHR